MEKERKNFTNLYWSRLYYCADSSGSRDPRSEAVYSRKCRYKKGIEYIQSKENEEVKVIEQKIASLEAKDPASGDTERSLKDRFQVQW